LLAVLQLVFLLALVSTRTFLGWLELITAGLLKERYPFQIIAVPVLAGFVLDTVLSGWLQLFVLLRVVTVRGLVQPPVKQLLFNFRVGLALLPKVFIFGLMFVTER
jgi:hypothetical protein